MECIIESIMDLIMFVFLVIIKTIYFIILIIFYFFPEMLILFGGFVLFIFMFLMIDSDTSILKSIDEYGMMLAIALPMMISGLILEIWLSRREKYRFKRRIKAIFHKFF